MRKYMWKRLVNPQLLCQDKIWLPLFDNRLLKTFISIPLPKPSFPAACMSSLSTKIHLRLYLLFQEAFWIDDSQGPLFCGSPPRHSGWAGSTAAPGHWNRRYAHFWIVSLFPWSCIHPPKRRRKSQIKVSCLIEKSRVSCDERQTTAWMKMEISQAL